MYESMIKVIEQQVQVHMEDEVMRAVQRVGISVDKEELIRALKYDRGQYEKGYDDGKNDIIQRFIREDEAYICPLCAYFGRSLGEPAPCRKCKCMYGNRGEDYYFSLKEQ